MSMLPTTNNAPKCVECKFNFASVNELRDDNPNDLFWTLCDDCFYDQERDEEAEKEEDDECFQEGIITYRQYRKHLIKQHAIGSNNIIRRWLKYSNANNLEWATKLFALCFSHLSFYDFFARGGRGNQVQYRPCLFLTFL